MHKMIATELLSLDELVHWGSKQLVYHAITVDAALAAKDARIAELKWCLQEAMQWNWMEEDLPEDLTERCDKALSL